VDQSETSILLWKGTEGEAAKIGGIIKKEEIGKGAK
jgi:hypothetical protein